MKHFLVNNLVEQPEQSKCGSAIDIPWCSAALDGHDFNVVAGCQCAVFEALSISDGSPSKCKM